MRSAGVAFLLSLVVAAFLTPVARGFALRFGWLDHARGSRKIHGKPIPRIGGVAIILGFLAPLIALAIYQTGTGKLFYQNELRAFGLMAAGVVIGLLGLYDDIKGANAKKKLSVQGTLAVALYLCGFKIQQLATPFGFTIDLGQFALPFTVFWIVGVINALNLIDGLDGLAGGVAFFAVGTTFVIAFMRGDALMMLFMACLGGAVLGFLFYNFNPASIFMGDTGSMFLGLVLAVGSIQTSQKSSTAVAILIPIIVLGLPIADTLMAMGRRAFRGRPIFSADKEHIHHRLLALGLSHRKAVLVLYSACVVLAAAALSLVYASSLQTVVILTFLGASFVVGMRSIGLFRIEHASQMGKKRQRNRRLRAAVRAAGERLSHAESPDDLWESVRVLEDDFEAASLGLCLLSPGKKTDVHVRRYTTRELTEGTAALSRSIEFQGEFKGALELAWTDGRLEIDRDDEIAAEVLCDHLSSAWKRVHETLSDQRPRPTTRGNLSIVS
ncbi:MAG: undecaprenyl/decaprenyl-phosphate alpha-N-acetylglucosaminyl 1-phosphate transferase [Myxococcales bacterium]|nr:undecaprenyl/decaprenyl-phosphate alpha-N-acetylglucosaminyl 1-phosphate transferase [Myxococcales bacterium]